MPCFAVKKPTKTDTTITNSGGWIQKLLKKNQSHLTGHFQGYSGVWDPVGGRFQHNFLLRPRVRGLLQDRVQAQKVGTNQLKKYNRWTRLRLPTDEKNCKCYLCMHAAPNGSDCAPWFWIWLWYEQKLILGLFWLVMLMVLSRCGTWPQRWTSSKRGNPPSG